MDEKRLKTDEYEKQYYGFSSTEFFEDFKSQVSKTIIMALKQVEKTLEEEQCNGALTDQTIIEIYKIYMEKAEVPLQKFKEETRKIFAIPKNVLLEEDKYNTGQYSDEGIIELRKEVAELEKKLIQEQVFLAKCTQMKDIVDTVIKPIYEKVNNLIKTVESFPANTQRDENEKNLLELHEQLLQHYLGSETNEVEDLDLSTYFYKKSNNVLGDI